MKKTPSRLTAPFIVTCSLAWLGVVDGCTYDASELQWRTDGGADRAAYDGAGDSPVDVGGKDVGPSGYDAGIVIKDANAILTDAAFVDSSSDLFDVEADAPAARIEGGSPDTAGEDGRASDVSLNSPADSSTDLLRGQADAPPGGDGSVGSIFDASTDLPVTTCSPAPKSTGGIACPYGECTIGMYSGSTFATTDGLTSIICMSANSLCAAGSTAAWMGTTNNNWGAQFGLYLSPASTPTDLVPVQLLGSGISVTLSSLPTVQAPRVNVVVGGTAYCAGIGTVSQTLPWTSFNTKCYNDNSGTFLSGGAPNAATMLYFSAASTTASGGFDFCVTSLSFPGSETCPVGYHDNGTGTCVLVGACSTGYHDGGTGACVLTGTCSVGYNNCSGTCSFSSCSVPCLVQNCVNGVCTCEM